MKALCALALASLSIAPAYSQADHVIVIGIDGLAAEAVRLNPVPRMRELMGQGAWSLKARGVMPTVSSPNWASMIMGAGPEQHGVTSNDWKPDKYDFSPMCSGLAPTFPTIFGVMRQQRPSARISILHDWDEFDRLVEKSAPTLMRHVEGSAQTVAAAVEEWKTNRPQLLFLHLDLVDDAGHAHGWHTPEYRKAVAEADELAGKIADAVKQSGLGAQTAIFISADHGGVGKNHGGNTMTELEIPWIAAGAGIAHAGELASPINTYDTAATIAALLHLKTPSCWIARPVLEAIEKR